MSFKITPILLLVLLFGIGLQKAWGINAEVTYYHNDLLGSPVAATDEAGEVIWREDYNPFGEKREAPLENANDVGFTGHQSDDDVGLTYMRARYYDPLVGRFYGVDPVGFTGGIDTFNRYAYVANNPFKYLDPTGMSKEDSKRTVRDLKKQEQKCSEGWRCYSSGHQSRYDQGGNAHKDQQGGGSMSMGAVLGVAGIAAVADSPVPGPGDVVAVGIIIVGGGTVLYNALTTDGSAASSTTSSGTNQCTSGCTLLDGTQIPVGTVSFRLDNVPPSTPHFPFEGSHVHLFRANQNPNNCQCFWKEFNVVAPPPPADAIPIQPFLN